MLFRAAAFVGSALLFLVQPMIARMLLPQAGGAPAVWTVSVLFFQTALLAGYSYAHWLGALRRRQLALHAGLLLLPLAALPFEPIEGAPAAGAFTPMFWILETLVFTIGLPFFLLAAGTPLLQRWLSLTPEGRDPYSLYAASNAGSLLALCSYPVLIEPAFGLARQWDLWAWGYGSYLVLAVGCALRVWSRGNWSDSYRRSSRGSEGSRLTSKRRALWVGLAAAPSSMMLGVTSVLTTDVAPMPFLWILPLALYLLTFVIAFSRSAVLPRRLWSRILPIAAVVFTLLWTTHATEPLPVVVPAYLVAFFVAAMACHIELARQRPDPSHLTAFYLLVGVGGLLGGAFNTLIAPLLFEAWTELPLAFVASCLLVPRTSKKAAPLVARSDIAVPLAVGAAALLLVELGDRFGASGHVREVLTAGIPALLVYLVSERRIRFALTLGAVLWAASHDTALRAEPRLTDRSFFGVHRVTRVVTEEDGSPIAFHQLYHGTTVHGVQRVEPETGVPTEPREALAYYSRTSPIGRRFAALDISGTRRVGLVGLGAGSLLAYAEDGQSWSVFEIDLVVQRIAEDERYFSYLAEARNRGVEVEVVLGDARLTLGSSAGSFDLLVLDAFTSGAIPVHLLTREAFRVYEGHVARDGTLALHISNRHLDLAPLVRAMANDLGFAVVIEEDVATTPVSSASRTLPSRWAFLKRSPGLPGSRDSGRAGVWTDDRSDLWSLFQW